jgi:hypothetical protein
VILIAWRGERDRLPPSHQMFEADTMQRPNGGFDSPKISTAITL